VRILINGLQAGNRSGTGRYTVELVQALGRVAPEHALSVVWPSHLLATAPRQGARVLACNARPLARVLAEQRGLRGFGADAADIVHYPANFGPLARVPGLVVTVHDLGFLRNPDWFPQDRAWYYRFLAKQTLRRARRIIADSEATKRDVEALLGIAPDRVDVVPLGVSPRFRPQDAAAVAAARARFRLPASYLLYVGTMEPRKNLVRVVEAYSRIAGEIPQDLVIAGRNGWKHAPIHEAAKASPHAARIHFPGFIAQDDLPAVLSGARAFVWPSLFEGFGLPVLEAMACGTPVLTSDRSSLPEVAGAAALLIDPEDGDAIAGGLRRLAQEDHTCATLRHAGLERAAGFTWDRTARETLRSYEAALG
jgi:glycosyltransferase involved in cell wall biosynthesis